MSKENVHRGSGNVFADLGIPNPKQYLAKAELAAGILKIVQQRRLSQAATGKLLGISEPRVSALLDGFSSGRLLRFLDALGCAKPQGPKSTNKVHFACFDCRKSFKQLGSSNWDVSVPVRPFKCPDCKRPMVPLGKYFKAPSRRARAQWLKVELLYRTGERFASSHVGLSQSCRTLGGTIAHLVGGGRDEREVRSLLESIRNVRR